MNKKMQSVEPESWVDRSSLLKQLASLITFLVVILPLGALGVVIVDAMTDPGEGANIAGGGILMLLVTGGTAFASYLDIRWRGYSISRILLSVALVVVLIVGIGSGLDPQLRAEAWYMGLGLLIFMGGAALIGAQWRR